MFRTLTDIASKYLGESIIPVNKPGGSGTLAAASLKTVKPDGYTLAVSINNLLSVPYVQDVTFDPMKDFTYILRTHGAHIGLSVRSDSPWKDLKDIVDYAKQHPNEIKYSTSSPGGVHRFAMEDIALKEEIKWNVVPYPGGAQAITALLGGHVHASSQDTISAGSHIESGTLRLLTVFTEKRSERFPNVPTLKELGYTPWFPNAGVLGPAGMDHNVVKILHDAFKRAVEDPTFIAMADKFDSPILYLNSEDYDLFMRKSYAKYGEAIRKVGLLKKN